MKFIFIYILYVICMFHIILRSRCFREIARNRLYVRCLLRVFGCLCGRLLQFSDSQGSNDKRNVCVAIVAVYYLYDSVF